MKKIRVISGGMNSNGISWRSDVWREAPDDWPALLVYPDEVVTPQNDVIYISPFTAKMFIDALTEIKAPAP